MIPRSYQEECIQALFNYFAENDSGNPLAALPTGTGKAFIIAEFIRRIMLSWPGQRILSLVHTKELVDQNSKTLVKIWPLAPVGVYCAGLDSKDTVHPVIFGSLGSVRNSIESFGWRDLIILDEAHCLSPDEATGYQKIISGLLEINPNLRVIGLSATIFRLGQGMLTDNGFFTDVCFDITGVEAFNRLIAEGFLAPLVTPSQIKNQLDVTGIAISKGDFNQTQLQKAVDKQELTYAAIKEAIEIGYNRNCWLTFASGIEHSEHIAEMLQSFGISAVAIHSKIKDDERDRRIIAFKQGEVKCLVGFRVLTTGFDHPPIDFIIDLYPTVSPGMHVQKYGRGTRPYDGTDAYFPFVKQNCLVADFSGNTRRLGPINDPLKPRKKGDKTGDAPVKICEKCGLYNHASARYCGGKPEASNEGCGFEFTFKTKITSTAGTNEIIKGDFATIEYINVDRVIYHRHSKQGMPTSMKVSYYSGLDRYTEYVCLEHKGYAKGKAQQWWIQRHNSPPPKTTEEALSYSSLLKCPKKIRVRTDINYPEILGAEW
jgi:DNA repair protein RadD